MLSSEETPRIWWHVHNTTIKIQLYFRMRKESLVGREGYEIRKFRPVLVIN